MFLGANPTATAIPFLERMIKSDDYTNFEVSINSDDVVDDSS